VVTTEADELVELYLGQYRMTKRKRTVLRLARTNLDPATYRVLLERIYR
jgi:hypothetical protein